MQIAPVPSIPAVLDISNVEGVFIEFAAYIRHVEIILMEDMVEDMYSFYIFASRLERCLVSLNMIKQNYLSGVLPFLSRATIDDSVMKCLANLSVELGELREEFMSYDFGVNSSDVYSASAVGSSFGGSVGGGASANPVAPAEVVATKEMRIDNLRTQLSALSGQLNTLKSSGGSRVTKATKATKASFDAVEKHIKEAEVCISKAAVNQNPNDQAIRKLLVVQGTRRGWETLLREAETAIGSAQRMVGALAVPAAATAGGGASAQSDGAIQIAYAFPGPVDNVGSLPVAVALGASVATNPQGIFGGESAVATQVASASHQSSGSR